MTNPNAIEDAKAELAREMRLLTSLCAMFDAAIGHSEPADRQTIRVQEIRELGIRASRALAALSEKPALGDETAEDEAYKLGVVDGYQEAVQDIDIRTGGDGEYRWSTDPERSVPDPAEMIKRIVARFAALSAPTVSGLTEEEGWQDIGTLPLLEGAQIVKGGTVPYSAAEGLVTECFDGVTTIAPLKKGDRIWPHMHKWRPTSAPSIDWKRVEEVKVHAIDKSSGG